MGDGGPDGRTTGRSPVATGFLLVSTFFLVIGGLIALLMRWHLGYPDVDLPPFLLSGLLPEAVASGGRLLPQGYGALFTMHGTFMMFYALIPALIGYGGYRVMLEEIDSVRSVIPSAPWIGLILLVVSGIALIISFTLEGGPASFGWTAYAPLSAEAGYTGVGIGADLWLISLLLYAAGLFTVAADLAATVIARSRTRLIELPLVTWSILVSAVLLVLSLPILASGLLLLLSDRLLETSFYLPEGLRISGDLLGRGGEGEPLLWQHLFWYFGHPLVYVLILPVMGGISRILPEYAGRPLHGTRSMFWSTAAIAFLGMVVWGHHMFQTGLNPLLRSTFALSTLLIAVPSTVKVYHWLATLRGGRIRLEPAMLFALGFLALFVIGGLSGVFLGSTPVDMYLHDSYFVVAHIHYVLFGGSIFGAFAALYHWYRRRGGGKLRRVPGIIHFCGTFIGMNLVFFPMHFLGTAGYPRRLYDASGYEYLSGVRELNELITVGALLLGASQLILVADMLIPDRNRNNRRIHTEENVAEGNQE